MPPTADPNNPINSTVTSGCTVAGAILGGLGVLWAFQVYRPKSAPVEPRDAVGQVQIAPQSPPKNLVAEIQIGMSPEEVRFIAGEPSHVQQFKSDSGYNEAWYYGSVQVFFDTGGSVESVNSF